MKGCSSTSDFFQNYDVEFLYSQKKGISEEYMIMHSIAFYDNPMHANGVKGSIGLKKSELCY